MPPAHPCLVCGGPVEHETALCSAACLREAEAEVRDNADTYRRLRARSAGADQAQTLRELCVRNGRLTSAIARATAPQRIDQLRREESGAGAS